jgi:hypothetical protein
MGCAITADFEAVASVTAGAIDPIDGCVLDDSGDTWSAIRPPPTLPTPAAHSTAMVMPRPMGPDNRSCGDGVNDELV